MRFRHGELEELREDLTGWVQRKKGGSAPRMSYKHATRMGVYRLHRGDNVGDALKYLNDFLASYALNNPARRIEAELNLRDYASWLGAQTLASVSTKARIRTELGNDLHLGGEIPRIDLLPNGGYRAVLLGEDSPDWQHQLRMPLIQRAVAQLLKRPENLVSVGVQSMNGSGLLTRSYSRSAIEDAKQELVALDAMARKLLLHH